MYFGYTFCPIFVRATLANVGQALRDLGSRADDIQVIMVSLDPERDTPEKLSDYVDQFHPSMIGITGTKKSWTKLLRYTAFSTRKPKAVMQPGI